MNRSKWMFSRAVQVSRRQLKLISLKILMFNTKWNFAARFFACTKTQRNNPGITRNKQTKQIEIALNILQVKVRVSILFFILTRAWFSGCCGVTPGVSWCSGF